MLLSSALPLLLPTSTLTLSCVMVEASQLEEAQPHTIEVHGELRLALGSTL